MVAAGKSKEVKRNGVIPVCLAIVTGLLIINTSTNSRVLEDNSKQAQELLRQPANEKIIESGKKESAQESKFEFVHDDPKHYWHWTRERPPCPEMSKKIDCDGKNYKEMYNHFHEYGWVTFTSCSIQARGSKLMDPIIEYLTGLERGRASTVKHPEIKDVALDPDTLEFMEYLHGRQAFPFQTLDFKVGTQQGLHSDLIFFNSQPRGMMAAAWLALEDVTPNNGPLVFIPKSHQYGTWDFNDIGLHYEADLKIEPGQADDVEVYYEKLPAAIENVGLKRAYADNVKRGQSFLWAAGLVHGGSEIKDKETTRMSQVTHYYFEGSQFYWEPRHSNPQENKYLFINKQILPCTHQPVKGMKEIYPCVQKTREQFRDHFLEDL